jgi:hypothetical protein
MIHSFLMIGQSNMAGRGRPGDLPPVENERLFMLRNGRWRALVEPVNCDRPFSGTSLAVSFADEYSRRFDCDTGLIPCADGGTSLEDWSVGGQLYSHAVAQTRLALRVSELKGILWHQGEADSENETNALSYKKRFMPVISALKKELGVENIPVIMGELGAFLSNYKEGKCEYFPIVNKALAEIAAGHAGFALASSAGFESNGDDLHFNAASLKEFGRRYFEKYLELCRG